MKTLSTQIKEEIKVIFTTNTKPLSDALALGVINSNVNKFYSRSCIAQIRAKGNDLTLNLEAAFIKTEIRLKGNADNHEVTGLAMVDCLLLKQLVSTFESSTVQIEFVDGGIVLKSGSSKFTLSSIVDADDIELDKPSIPDYSAESIDIDKSDWRFIKDNQMYAIAMSFIHPVYTRVWIGDQGDVLVGDMDNSIFTHSKKNKLGTTCLLSDTIINLFNSLPEGAKLVKGNNRAYVITIKTDAFDMLCEFKPQYEDEEEVGSYSSDIILNMMNHPGDSVEVSTVSINKYLSQATILSTNSDDTVKFIYDYDNPEQVVLKDKNSSVNIPCKGMILPVDITFKTGLLRSAISNYSDETLRISPYISDDEVVGILIWSKDLTTVLAGVEQ